MSLSQRRLTYGMAFPLLNIGILQSMKNIRNSNFIKKFIILKQLPGMVSERILVSTARKIPVKYIHRDCISVQVCAIPKTLDIVFAYLNCLSCFHFFMVHFRSDKVFMLLYKGVPDDWS